MVLFNTTNMAFIIHDSMTIVGLQREFNKRYPYLKLEFFPRVQRTKTSGNLKFLLPGTRKLEDIRRTRHDRAITVTPDMRVSDLERLFGVEYNLGVQVFRKSGKSWLETVFTNSWTLQEQNSEGEVLSKPANQEPEAS
jgi:hypothetical protein